MILRLPHTSLGGCPPHLTALGATWHVLNEGPRSYAPFIPPLDALPTSPPLAPRGRYDRELTRRAPHPPSVQGFRAHTLKRVLEPAAGGSATAASGATGDDTDAAGSGGKAAGKSGASGGSDAAKKMATEETEEELSQAIKLSLSSNNPTPTLGSSSGAGAAGAAGDAAATPLATPPPADFHFITECFFLALGAAHVGLLPALERAQNFLNDLLRKTHLPPLHENASSGEYTAQLTAMQNAGYGPQQVGLPPTSPWPSMAFRGLPRPSMAFHDLPRPSTASHGLSWPSMAFHDLPRSSMAIHDLPPPRHSPLPPPAHAASRRGRGSAQALHRTHPR